MGIKHHPGKGRIVMVDFSKGFVAPEMIKRRPCIVVSPPIRARPGLLTVVPLSTTAPDPVMAYHCQIHIPFDLPPTISQRAWVKADMINSVSFDRTHLIFLGKTGAGKRNYQKSALCKSTMSQIYGCILVSLGLEPNPNT